MAWNPTAPLLTITALSDIVESAYLCDVDRRMSNGETAHPANTVFCSCPQTKFPKEVVYVRLTPEAYKAISRRCTTGDIGGIALQPLRNRGVIRITATDKVCGRFLVADLPSDADITMEFEPFPA